MQDTFLATLESITILLGIGILGFVLISRQVIPEQLLRSLSRLALEVALPCLVFAKIMNNFTPGNFAGWWRLPLWYAGFVTVTGILSFGFGALIGRKGSRREVIMALLYQNALFVPLIIIAEVHGYESNLLVMLFFFTALFSPFLFGTAPFFFMRPTLRGIPWSKIINPVVLATVAGLGLRLGGMEKAAPRFVISGAEMVGSMSAPLLLIILGGTIYLDFKAEGALQWGVLVRFVVVKNIIFPAAIIAGVWLIKPVPQVAYLLVLQGAVPPVTSLPIIVERNGGDRKLINQLLVGSFAASLLTIPVAMAACAMLFE